MFSPSKLERFKVSKEELAKLSSGFYSEALPMLENLFDITYWIVLDKKPTKKIIKQVFFEAIEYCNVTKNHADWHSWIYRIWMREINDFYEKRENDIETNFEFIDSAEISTYDNFSTLIKETNIEPWLGKLPAVLRIPLILKEVANYNYEKISELIDVSYGVVASRIYRARKLLFLFSGRNFNYLDEKQKWLNKESTKEIFEIRKSALLTDEELCKEETSVFLNFVNQNSRLENEIKLQGEIKKLIGKFISGKFSLNKLKSKIHRKARKKFDYQ